MGPSVSYPMIMIYCTHVSALPSIENRECVERLTEHEAQPSALLCFET